MIEKKERPKVNGYLKIILTISLFLLAYTFTGIWWAGSLNQTVETNEKHNCEKFETLEKKVDKQDLELKGTMLRGQERIQISLDKLDNKIDKVLINTR